MNWRNRGRVVTLSWPFFFVHWQGQHCLNIVGNQNRLANSQSNFKQYPYDYGISESNTVKSGRRHEFLKYISHSVHYNTISSILTNKRTQLSFIHNNIFKNIKILHLSDFTCPSSRSASFYLFIAKECQFLLVHSQVVPVLPNTLSDQNIV